MTPMKDKNGDYIRDEIGRIRYRKGLVLPPQTREDRKRREFIFRDMLKRRPAGKSKSAWRSYCHRKVFGY